MKVMVIGRHQRILDAVIPVLEGAGFAASAVTTTSEAITHVKNGSVDALIIGAGVDGRSRRRLRAESTSRGVRVIEATPGHGPADVYVRKEVVPLLRKAAN